MQSSPAIALSNPDALQIANNEIVNGGRVVPDYPFDTRYPLPRDQSVAVLFGVQNLPSYGSYVNERTAFRGFHGEHRIDGRLSAADRQAA